MSNSTCTHKKIRSRMAQFRLGILPLHIETGRYDNKPVFDRKCNYVNYISSKMNTIF